VIAVSYLDIIVLYNSVTAIITALLLDLLVIVLNFVIKRIIFVKRRLGSIRSWVVDIPSVSIRRWFIRLRELDLILVLKIRARVIRIIAGF
jgi:hypothetical protein